MRKSFCLVLALLLVGALILSSVAAAATYTTYTVHGNTLEEVQNYMNTHGPTDSQGNHYPGMTYIELTSNIQMDPPKLIPIIPEPWWMAIVSGTVTWGINATIELPEWDEYSQAGPNAQAEWDRYVAALRTHEEGHEQVANETLANLQPPAQTSFTGVGIGVDPGSAMANAQASFDQQVDQERQRIQAAIDAAEQQYDNDTQHGATQGATLDTTITDDTPQDRIRGLSDDIDLTNASDGVANSLRRILNSALRALQRGSNNAARNQLNAFINHVNAQAGKPNGPTQEEAQHLTGEAQQIRDSIN